VHKYQWYCDKKLFLPNFLVKYKQLLQNYLNFAPAQKNTDLSVLNLEGGDF
jgi:hypothetical protein